MQQVRVIKERDIKVININIWIWLNPFTLSIFCGKYISFIYI